MWWGTAATWRLVIVAVISMVESRVETSVTDWLVYQSLFESSIKSKIYLNDGAPLSGRIITHITVTRLHRTEHHAIQTLTSHHSVVYKIYCAGLCHWRQLHTATDHFIYLLFIMIILFHSFSRYLPATAESVWLRDLVCQSTGIGRHTQLTIYLH